jgi:hypothetical protein
MESLEAYSVVVGWNITKWATLRGEYTRQDIDLVKGSRATLQGLADDVNYYGVEIGVHF